MDRKLFRINDFDILVHILSLAFFLDTLVDVAFEFMTYRLEWGFLGSFAVFIYGLFKLRVHNDIKIKYVAKPLILFVLWNIILSLISVARFTSHIYFVGIVHLLRFIVLFIPFLWIYNLSAEKKKRFYNIWRIYAFVTLLIILVQVLGQGNMNYTSFSTDGLGKNALAYVVICNGLLFCCFENIYYVSKPVKPYLWLPLITVDAFLIRSGTGVAFAIVIVIWYIVTRTKINNKYKLIIIGLCIPFALSFLNIDIMIKFFDVVHIKKISDLLNAMKDNGGFALDRNNQVRVNTWMIVIKELNLEMIIGRFYYYFFAVHGYTAHHYYLQILYDSGIIGFVLFIVFCIRCIKSASERFPVILMLLYSFTECYLIRYEGLIILALLVSLHKETERIKSYEDPAFVTIG